MGSERVDLPAILARLDGYDNAVEDYWNTGADSDPAIAKLRAMQKRDTLIESITTITREVEVLRAENERHRDRLRALLGNLWSEPVVPLGRREWVDRAMEEYDALCALPAPAGKGEG